jgi:hypothetical protein
VGNWQAGGGASAQYGGNSAPKIELDGSLVAEYGTAFTCTCTRKVPSL